MDSLLEMLVAAAPLLAVRAAHCLGTEDVSAEETDTWVSELLL